MSPDRLVIRRTLGDRWRFFWSALAVALNTMFWSIPIYVMAGLRMLSPGQKLKTWTRRQSASAAEMWIAINNRVINRFDTRWDVEIPEDLVSNGSYIVNANHQSWVDILVLQRVFNRRAPFLRFFIKQELIWVPFLGPAWWALDFPFMKRLSRDQIAARPELKNKDLESARAACEKFRRIPVSIMNFLEGTRFSDAKHARQKSPYEHLLRPKLGGLGQVLFSLGDTLDSLIDVTIVYPDGVPGVFDLLAGRVDSVVVRARQVPIPLELRGRNFREERDARQALKAWSNGLWREKDQLITDLVRTEPRQ